MAPVRLNLVTALVAAGVAVTPALGFFPSVPRSLVLRANPELGVSKLYEQPPTPTTKLEEEAPAPPRTIEDDLPQLKLEYELTRDINKASVETGEKTERLEEFQTRLEKTMEVKAQVEEMFVAEVMALADKLEQVKTMEEDRSASVVALIGRFEDVLEQKKAAVENDEQLLGQMQSTQDLVREASIKDMMDKAIEDKASLNDIERVLIGKMEDCLEQLKTESEQAIARAETVSAVRATLPDVNDAAAVRAYTWADVEKLKERLVKDGLEAAQREQAIETIKSEFAAALEQRKIVLEPEYTPPAPAKTQAVTVDVTPGSVPAKPAKTVSASSSSIALTEEALLASKDVSVALVKLAAATISVAGSALKADEFASTAESASKATVAATGAFGGIVSAFNNFNTAYQEEMTKAIDDTFSADKPNDNEWVVQRAWRSASQSDKVKGALSEAQEKSKAALTQATESGKLAGKWVGKTAGTISTGDKNTDAIVEAANEVVESTRRVGSAFLTLVSRAVDAGAPKQLPPSS